MPSPCNSVGGDAGYQTRGCDFQSQIGQNYFLHFTKVTVTSVVRLPPIGLQFMWERRQMLGHTVVWSTGVIKQGVSKRAAVINILKL